MNSEETVGKYLTRAKIKDATSWNLDIDEADMYHVCNGLLKAGLKSRMLKECLSSKLTKNYSTTLKTSGNEATSWRTTSQENKIHQV